MTNTGMHNEQVGMLSMFFCFALSKTCFELQVKERRTRSMRKLYAKKLGSIALMSLVFFGIYFLATFLLQTFVNFIESNLLKALIFLAIPAIFVVIRIYRRRLENAELRRA